MTIPQLRIRTEFSFRYCFGPLARVAEALSEMECPTAGIVDADTWGHVRFAKALKDKPTRALFGSEIPVPMYDGRKPLAWTLASESKEFYRFSSACRKPEADIPKLFAESLGIVRFAGAGLTDPACFDYVDINPESPLQQRAALALARHTGKPLVVTSANSYPRPQDFAAFMAVIDRQHAAPQWIMNHDELRASLSFLSADEWKRACSNTFEAAERCTSVLQTAPMIQVAGSLRKLVDSGLAERIRLGNVVEWNSLYQDRLDTELRLIEEKNFGSYFVVVADLIKWAKQRMLVGPGRGSSAGSLVCYLLGITEVDPLQYGLLFERFIDVTREDFPDIDIDFNHEKRDLVFGYLESKYGAECVARIGNVSMLKARSLLPKMTKKFGVPEHARFRLLDVIPEMELPGSSIYGKTIKHVLETTEVGRRFKEQYPASCIVAEGENHADHTSVHAGGVAVCNAPIVDYCTVGPDGVAHLDKVDAEEINLLKIDALSIRTLAVIEGAGVVSSNELYALKPVDVEVLKVFNDGRFVGVFQFEGGATTKVASKINITEFKYIDHITALSRPGPLQGGATEHYIKRAAGLEEVSYSNPALENILSKTYGVILYQEQVMRICKEIAGFPWEDVADIRKAIGKKKGNEYFNKRRAQFVEGAARTVGMDADSASSLWDAMLTFGTYGFNQAHSVSYGLVSYWCAWMKRYHPLEYAASCLRHAKDDAQTTEILREMQTRYDIDYVAFDIDKSGIEWQVVNGKLLGGWTNIHGIGIAKASKYIAQREAGTLDEKTRVKILSMPIQFRELYPLKREYRDWYMNPENYGCLEGTQILTSNKFPDNPQSPYRNWPELVWLAKVVGLRHRDDNEQRLVDRRNGEQKTGNTTFADIVCADDFGIPVTCRVKTKDFEPLGRMALQHLKIGDVVMVRGKKCPGYNILHIVRMRCLNAPDKLNPAFANAVFNSDGVAEVVGPRDSNEPLQHAILHGDGTKDE